MRKDVLTASTGGLKLENQQKGLRVVYTGPLFKGEGS